MPDLLTHVLAVYVVATGLTWTVRSVPRTLVPVSVVGAVLPDVVKIHLLVPNATVEAVLGVPFAWAPIHRLGGVLVLAGLCTLALERSYRRGAFVALVGGASTHLFLDSLIRRANGLTPPYLYPFSWWHPPSGDLYLSSEPWPATLALIVAAAVFFHDRRRRSDTRDA